MGSCFAICKRCKQRLQRLAIELRRECRKIRWWHRSLPRVAYREAVMRRRGADGLVLARKRGNAREVIAIGSGQPAMGGRRVVRRRIATMDLLGPIRHHS